MAHYLIIKDSVLVPTEIALTANEQERGLMNRDVLPSALSFLYYRPTINKFWMKNTKLPLDIVFCYQNKIAQICHGEPFSLKLIGQDDISDLVVEFPAGFCQQHRLQVGDTISLFLKQNHKL